MMKRILLLIILILIVFAGFYAYENRTELVQEANQFLFQSPCATPKEFRIGSIDPRFGISEKEVIQDADEAASAWKNSQGKTLLIYNPNADMPISMIYDQRQALNSQINNLNNQVTQKQNTLKPEISDYQQKVAAFQQQSNALNSQIQYWNSKGGAPSDVYNKLITQQQTLQQQAAQLQQMANELNQSTDQYNQQIGQLNQKVNVYNNVLSLTPEEGLYTRNGTNESIDIYITNSQRELIHTLAHEMGHSLGLGHNSNPNSIMYPYTNLAITPSINDDEALAQVCQKRSIFEITGQNIILILGTLHQDIDNTIAKYQ